MRWALSGVLWAQVGLYQTASMGQDMSLQCFKPSRLQNSRCRDFSITTLNYITTCKEFAASKAEYWAFRPRCKRRGRDESDLDGLCAGAILYVYPNGSEKPLCITSSCLQPVPNIPGHPSLSHEETSWNHHWLQAPSLPVLRSFPQTGLYLAFTSIVVDLFSAPSCFRTK